MRFAVAGAVAMALAVGAGAFGAHGLKAHLEPEALALWETAARYHVYHGLGLFAVAYVAGRSGPSRWVNASGALLLLGLLLFSGSLYGYALTAAHGLVYVTPVGGLAWIVGWLCLAVGAARAR